MHVSVTLDEDAFDKHRRLWRLMSLLNIKHFRYQSMSVGNYDGSTLYRVYISSSNPEPKHR